MAPRVILVHGIWMPGAVMAWMAARLREAGFECETFAYHGVTRGPKEATSRLAEVLEAASDQGLLADSGALFTARVDARTAARVGHGLELAVDPTRFHYYDAATGDRLSSAGAPELAAVS